MRLIFFLLFKQPRQIRLNLVTQEVSAGDWVVGPLGNYGSEVLIITGQKHLQEVLKIEVAVLVRVKVFNNHKAVGLCCFFHPIVSVTTCFNEKKLLPEKAEDLNGSDHSVFISIYPHKGRIGLKLATLS